MKKAEKSAIYETILGMGTSAIKATLDELTRWSENHEKVQRCYFWKPQGNSAARAREAAWRTWDGEVTFGDVKIYYFSNCSRISCLNYYWTDGLAIAGEDMEDVNISFADINFFIYAMQEILKQRS